MANSPVQVGSTLNIRQAQELTRLASGMIDLGLTAQGYDPHKEIRDRETKLSVYANRAAVMEEAVFFVRIRPVMDKEHVNRLHLSDTVTSVYGLPVYAVYATLKNEILMPRELWDLIRNPRQLGNFKVEVY